MAFQRIDDDGLNIIELLDDQPNKRGGISAQQLKGLFDDVGRYVADYLTDTFIPELEGNGSVTGSSGAKSVGVASRAEFGTATNVEDLFLYFKTLIDAKSPSASIGNNDIKTRHLDHTVGSEAVDTGSIKDGAITNAKLAGSITSDKIASVLTSVLVGTITNAQLAGNISYDKLAGSIRASQLYGEIPADKLADTFNVTTFANKLSGPLPISKGGTGNTNGATKLTVISNPTFTWTNDSGITDFPYKGTYSNASITADTSADVIFGDADLENYSFSKRCNTDAGHLYIYCDVNPTLATTPIVRLFD